MTDKMGGRVGGGGVKLFYRSLPSDEGNEGVDTN